MGRKKSTRLDLCASFSKADLAKRRVRAKRAFRRCLMRGGGSLDQWTNVVCNIIKMNSCGDEGEEITCSVILSCGT